MRRLNRADNALGEPVLEVEDVVGRALELVGPDMRGGAALDKLPGDAQPVCGLANAAFQHVADAEFRGDLADVDRLALVGERGISGDDEQAGDLRQAGNQVFDEPVSEIFLLWVAAHVGERQHGDRGLARQRQQLGRRPVRTPSARRSACTRKTRTGCSMFFSVCSPMSSNARPSRSPT